MKSTSTLTAILLSFCVFANSLTMYGQQATVHAKNGMTAGVRNYKTFTAPYKNTSQESIEQNAGYEQHPEAGLLFAETPCDNCYELIGKRTEISKTFIKAGTDGSGIMQQTSTAPMHYKDATGKWMTIKTQLRPGKTGIYEAPEQESPVSIDTKQQFTSVGKTGSSIRFNNNLELIYIQPGGTEVSLGKANWANTTAGDDGAYVTNAWPGIDIEMYVIRGSVKTNFWINKAMPAYANGKLAVRDHLQMEGLSLYSQEQQDYTGNLEVRNNTGSKVYDISAATAFEKGDIKGSFRMLAYHINGNTLDIILPGDFLNRKASAYPVIIDPLLSTATSSPVTGTSYSPTWTVGCTYINPATVPAKVTISDIQFSFQYVTSGGALLNNGAFDFRLSTCRSPTPSAIFWNCNSILTGTCTGTGASIFSSLFPCAPPPACTPYNLNITMNFYQNYLAAAPCSNLYITAGTPLTITVFGNTIHANSITAGSSTLCQGQSTTLAASSLYGVPAYTYSWMPGSLTGSPVTISPTTTTTYTVVATDACGDTSQATKTITVNPLAVISGGTTVCTGGTSTLSASIGGGTWSSAIPATATIGSSSGIVTGVAAGNVTITYTAPTGCRSTTTVTVVSPTAPITGASAICQGTTTTMSDATPGGVWSSSNPAVGSIDASTGVLGGVSGGVITITYTALGCNSTKSFTVNPISAIGGTTTVCVGGSSTLTNIAPGGTWVSSNPSVATINASTGVVTGVAVGTTNITYTTPAGCTASITVTINLLSSISGNLSVCQGYTTTLTNPTPGGIWTSTVPAVATIGAATGTVTGISPGTTVISYTMPSGCYSTFTITVNPLASILGNTTICLGNTSALSCATPGGTWSSSNPGVATVNPSTGFVTSVSVGVTTISYITPLGCIGSVTFTVLAPPVAIAGPTSVCQGNTITLTNATPGGTWTSGSPSVATIGSLTGIVTGVTAGTTTIFYTLTGGCFAAAVITVHPITPITGPTVMCTGTTATMSDATTGGTWSSSNPAAATIGISSGLVTAAAGGTTTITYTTATGCTATLALTINPALPISGTTTVCQGSSTTLTNAIPSGTWSSSNPAVATIGLSTGIVSGVSGGSVTITYTTPAGCISTIPVTVNPVGPITGATTLCTGSTTTLTNSTPGGTWSSSNPAVATINATTGVVNAITNGTTNITYTTPAGCTNVITFTVSPVSPITGSTSICTTTTLSNATPGGTWTSSNPSIATIGLTSGIVTGLAPGTVTITYTTTSGCTTTTTLTVNPLVPITGVPTVCTGSTTALSNSVPGGTWSSINPAIAVVDPATGVVTGVFGGTTTIRYTTPTGCISSIFVTVFPLSPITGTTTVCQGSTTTLSNATTGGTWASTNTTVASVSVSTGIVVGVSAGTSTIVYTTSLGCVVSKSVTVYPLDPIAGSSSVCMGTTTTLTDATPGGAWSSSNPAAGSIDALTGTVAGRTAGTTTISYTTPAGCVATFVMTIAPIYAITGTTTICQGNTTTLANAAPGGSWVSTNPIVATIGISSGIVTGLTAGTTVISYITPAGCSASTTVTVNPLSPVTGISSICTGNTTTLSDATPSGSWSSANPTIATVGLLTGIVTGINPGTVAINYTTPTGCVATMMVTVHPYPSAIGGITSVCAGSTTVLSNALPGGTWTSSNTAAATINVSTGVVTGVATGTTVITYTTTGGCFVVTTVTVHPLPATITGIPSVCVGSTITLSDATTPGVWSSINPTIGTAGATTGIITGITAGIATIRFTTPAGCFATMAVTVHPLPSAITGSTTVCEGFTSTLYNSLPGGTWTSTNTSVATIGLTSGVVSGISTGTTTISYITPAGCFAVTSVLINPSPVITGTSSTNPTTCKTSDGTITLHGLTPGDSYSVTYLSGSTPVVVTIVANGAGDVVITGLAAGSYSGFQVTSALGCGSNHFDPAIILSLPSAPPVPVAANSSPICDGAALYFTATNTVTGVTYSWSGPAGFTSSIQNPTITPASLSNAGTYSVTATLLGCESAPATTLAVIHPIPHISDITFTNPSTCLGIDGTITLSGLLAGVTYTITYTHNSSNITTTVTANTAGKVVITGLSSGAYGNFTASSFTCPSNTAGPVTLIDPAAPPAPIIGSNSPICSGQALMLSATDDIPNLTYEWTGPNGFTSNEQNPVIYVTTMADSGMYYLTIRHRNCPTPASKNIIINPAVVLENVTPSHPIAAETSEQLYASGAEFYIWVPNDGSISNPNIDSPIATPLVTTTYTVMGMNIFGCGDTADVTLTIDYNINEFVPSAFTPNGDGLNDVFRVGNMKYDKLVDFSVFNRWGQLIYRNTYDAKQGWDGTFNGVPQDMGVYNYIIIVANPNGKNKTFKGEVTLVR